MAARSSPSRIWVWPSRRAPGLCAVLVAMWYAGASQGNGAAYLLCCVLASVALVSTIHAWRNLRGVFLEAGKIQPAFAGEELSIPVEVRSTGRWSHFGLQISASRRTPAPVAALEANRPAHVTLALLASRRGCFREVPVHLRSSFPLGFFTAGQELVLHQAFCVYPAPCGDRPLPVALAPAKQPFSGTQTTGEDYGGVRLWQPGESQRHIDWKAAARSETLLTKQWTGEVAEILHLDWHSLLDADPEARLSQLAKWIVTAERGGAAYALQLPGRLLPASRGDAHYHAALRALAEWENPEPAP